MVLEKNKNRINAKNIPKPKMVETWFGPNPPEVAEFESVPVTTSLISGLYKNTYNVMVTIGYSIQRVNLSKSFNLIFFSVVYKHEIPKLIAPSKLNATTFLNSESKLISM